MWDTDFDTDQEFYEDDLMSWEDEQVFQDTVVDQFYEINPAGRCEDAPCCGCCGRGLY